MEIEKFLQKLELFYGWLLNVKTLVKTNLVVRGWKGDPYCIHCGKIEIVDHLLYFMQELYGYYGLQDMMAKE